jgi:hypothetical protein
MKVSGQLHPTALPQKEKVPKTHCRLGGTQGQSGCGIKRKIAALTGMKPRPATLMTELSIFKYLNSFPYNRTPILNMAPTSVIFNLTAKQCTYIPTLGIMTCCQARLWCIFTVLKKQNRFTSIIKINNDVLNAM